MTQLLGQPPPGAKTVRSLDACLPCTLKDGGSSQAVIKAQMALGCRFNYGLYQQNKSIVSHYKKTEDSVIGVCLDKT